MIKKIYGEMSLLFFLPLLAIFLLQVNSRFYRELMYILHFITMIQTGTAFYLTYTVSSMNEIYQFHNHFQLWEFLPIFVPFQMQDINFKWLLIADPLALPFVVLTALIIQVSVWYTYLIPGIHYRFLLTLLFVVQFILVNFFCAYDSISFFVFFEAAVFPLFLMIGKFSKRIERIEASYLLYFYTYLGSISLLLSLCYISIQVGSTSFYDIYLWTPSPDYESILWIGIVLAIATKTPIAPFHIWLPKAHVEAPTVGSVILAALILKLAGFTVLRILLPIFSHNESTIYLQTWYLWISILGACFASFTALRQIDMKVIIAYSSVAHMSYSSVALFFWRDYFVVSGIQGMLTHGVVSAGLFFLIGSFYHRYGTRSLNEINGLNYIAPMYASFFFLFSLGNVCFPVYGGFLGELGVFISIFRENPFIIFFVLPSLIATHTFSFLLVTRLQGGSFKFLSLPNRPNDLLEGESLFFSILFLIIIILGSQTTPLFDLLWMAGWLVYFHK